VFQTNNNKSIKVSEFATASILSVSDIEMISGQAISVGLSLDAFSCAVI
jgi:hypothetical protein